MSRTSIMKRFGAGILAFAFVIAIAAATGLRWNTTGSYPKGLWRVTSSDWSKGDLVIVDTPSDCAVFDEALARGYLRGGHTASGCAPLLKRVAAVAGDRIDVDTVVRINGVISPNSGVRLHDSLGRPLPHLNLHRRLTAGEILVMSEYNPASFDSRYFGPLAASLVRGRAVPVLTW